MNNLCCTSHNPWPDGVCDWCKAEQWMLNRLAGPADDLFDEGVTFRQLDCGFWVREDEPD